MYISAGVDRERCRAQLRAFTSAYYGPQFAVDANCALGPPEVCTARLQGFLDAGAKTVMLGPTWPDVEQVRRFAHDAVLRLQ